MGMYDYINGEQVKIFFHPIYEERAKSTWHSGGSLIGYENGDSITLKTLYYKRPRNFIVLDENDYEERPIIHVIKDGKIHSTVELKDAVDTLFENNECILTYYGEKINLKTKEDCFNYIKEQEILSKKCDEIKKDYFDAYNNRYIPSFWIISHIKPTETVSKIRPDIDSKLDVIFRGIECIEEVKQVVEENFGPYEKVAEKLKADKDLVNKFCDMVYPIANEIHKSSGELLDSLSEKNRPLLQELEKEFQDKYLFEDSYTKENKFGEYLECLRYMYDDRNEERLIQDLPSNKERYISLTEAIREFAEKNENIINSYSSWLELSEVQAKNISNIIDCITKKEDKVPIGYLDEILESFNE